MKNNKGYIDALALFFLAAITGVVLFIACAVFGFPGGIGADYSNGSRTGVITKFSYKGLMFKSYEGEILMGGTRKVVRDNHVSSVANVVSFSVINKNVADKIMAAMQSGDTVEIVYNGYFMHPVGIDTDLVVTDVKPLK